MTGFSKILAVSAFLSVVSVHGRAQEPVAQEATLRIQTRVYNMARVRPTVLGGALIEASEIFQRVGGVWMDGSGRQRLGSRYTCASFPSSAILVSFWSQPPGLRSNLRRAGAGNDLFLTVSKWRGKPLVCAWLRHRPELGHLACMIGGSPSFSEWPHAWPSGEMT
jgi:hypothetical protein